MTATSLEKLCMSFKGATQDIKWGNDLCYLVGEKMFCTTSLEGFSYVSFKASPQDFGDLIERDGIIPAPYSARHYWVLVEEPRALRSGEWRDYLTKSYNLVFGSLSKRKKEGIMNA
jgi:predicted DNA-binding protein (MmcQ/YjbR family)